jgi:glycosyltransferase involved in cell wall biosynthesis
MPAELAVIVVARDEAARLPATLSGLGRAMPDARIVVADDASVDATAALARAAGATVVSAPRRLGKGGAATLAARALLAGAPLPQVVVLCDGDLGESAAALGPLVGAVRTGEGDLAVATFARRVGGGLGLVLAAARLVITRATGGPPPRAPLSGQRALRGEHLPVLLPFARGFGMETAMAVDAHRAGLRTVELELPLEHRATGRDLRGFLHRGRQLVDILRVARRAPRRR